MQRHGSNEWAKVSVAARSLTFGASPTRCVYIHHLRLRCRGRGGSGDAGNLNGMDHAEFDRMKLEILNEIRKEVHKMKQEIIDGRCSERRRPLRAGRPFIAAAASRVD